MQSTEIKTETQKLKIKQPIKKEYFEEVEIDIPYYFKMYLTGTLVKVESNRTTHVDNGNVIGIIRFNHVGESTMRNIAEGTPITEEEFETAKELAKAKINAL